VTEGPGNRFSGVSIVTDTSPVEAQVAADQWLQQNFNEQVTPTILTSTAATKPPELTTSIKAVAELIPTMPTPTTTIATTAATAYPYRAKKKTQSTGANDLRLNWPDGLALWERSVSHFTDRYQAIREVADIAYRRRHRTNDPNSRKRFTRYVAAMEEPCRGEAFLRCEGCQACSILREPRHAVHTRVP